MSPVVNLMVKKERYEGDFRFQHVFIRVNSESLAFYGREAETVEESALDKKLGSFLHFSNIILKCQRDLKLPFKIVFYPVITFRKTVQYSGNNDWTSVHTRLFYQHV